MPNAFARSDWVDTNRLAVGFEGKRDDLLFMTMCLFDFIETSAILRKKIPLEHGVFLPGGARSSSLLLSFSFGASLFCSGEGCSPGYCGMLTEATPKSGFASTPHTTQPVGERRSSLLGSVSMQPPVPTMAAPS
jgi:hypothetical protein